MPSTHFSSTFQLLVFEEDQLTEPLPHSVMLEHVLVELLGNVVHPDFQIVPGHRLDKEEDMVICHSCLTHVVVDVREGVVHAHLRKHSRHDSL